MLFASMKGTTKLETALLWGSLLTSLNFPGRNGGPEFHKMERSSALHVFLLTKTIPSPAGPSPSGSLPRRSRGHGWN